MPNQLERRNRELSILNQIAEALNRSVDLDEALQVTLRLVADLFDLQTGWVFLLHEDSDTHYVAASLNLPPALAQSSKKMDGGCKCLASYRDGALAQAANINIIECSRLRDLMAGTDDLRCHATIPLSAHGKKLGLLNVVSTDWRELSPDDLRLLYTVGDMLGIAVERARLFDHSLETGAVEERFRLAREIHDTLAQSMAAIALQLESADALLDAGMDEGNADLEAIHCAVMKSLHLTWANLEDVRRTVLDLRATPLEGRTLVEALQDLIEKCRQQWHCDISLKVMGGRQPLPARIEVGLYRIAQEALNNIANHAEASCAQLSLVIAATEVKLTIQDNGRGFDVKQTPTNRFGLVGMNERAQLLGGHLCLESCKGKGTKVAAQVPLKREI